jgi:hypothetical protein
LTNGTPTANDDAEEEPEHDHRPERVVEQREQHERYHAVGHERREHDPSAEPVGEDADGNA